jgi:hypothetical protein
MRTVVPLLLAWLGVALPAFADERTAAKAHFAAATSHFAFGEFAEAAQEYELAYKLHPDPALLFDAAQAHRHAGHLKTALLLYRNYVQMYPSGENSKTCRDQIDKLTQAIAADDHPSPATGSEAPPATGQTPPSPKVERQLVEVAPQQPQLTPVTQPEPRPRAVRPLYKKWWLWTAVGGAVAVITVATVVGIEAQKSGGSFGNVPDIGPRASALVTLGWGAR